MICFTARETELIARQGHWLYTGSDLGEVATNGRGLEETVDDTQGIEVGGTGRSASRICVLSSTCVVYSYTDTFYEAI